MTREDDEHPELRDMTRRFWVSRGLSGPVFVVAMGEMVPRFDALLSRLGSPGFWDGFELVLITPVVAWAGSFFFPLGLSLPGRSQSEHVHPDCAGGRRGL